MQVELTTRLRWQADMRDIEALHVRSATQWGKDLRDAADAIEALRAELEIANAEIVRLKSGSGRNVDTKPWGSTGVIR